MTGEYITLRNGERGVKIEFGRAAVVGHGTIVELPDGIQQVDRIIWSDEDRKSFICSLMTPEKTRARDAAEMELADGCSRCGSKHGVRAGVCVSCRRSHPGVYRR